MNGAAVVTAGAVDAVRGWCSVRRQSGRDRRTGHVYPSDGVGEVK